MLLVAAEAEFVEEKLVRGVESRLGAAGRKRPRREFAPPQVELRLVAVDVEAGRLGLGDEQRGARQRDLVGPAGDGDAEALEQIREGIAHCGAHAIATPSTRQSLTKSRATSAATPTIGVCGESST